MSRIWGSMNLRVWPKTMKNWVPVPPTIRCVVLNVRPCPSYIFPMSVQSSRGLDPVTSHGQVPTTAEFLPHWIGSSLSAAMRFSFSWYQLIKIGIPRTTIARIPLWMNIINDILVLFTPVYLVVSRAFLLATWCYLFLDRLDTATYISSMLSGKFRKKPKYWA